MALNTDQIYEKKQTKKRKSVYVPRKSTYPGAVYNVATDRLPIPLPMSDINAACAHLTVGTAVKMILSFSQLKGMRQYGEEAVAKEFRVCGVYPHHIDFTDGVVRLSMDKFDIYSQRNQEVLRYVNVKNKED